MSSTPLWWCVHTPLFSCVLHALLVVAVGHAVNTGQQTPDLRVNVEVVKGASHLDVQITLGTLQAVHGILVRRRRL